MKTKSLKLLSVRLLFLLGLYALIRFGFMRAHWDLYQDHSTSTLLVSFVHGVRFDIAALLWINSLFIVCAVMPIERVWERSFFFFLNGSFLIASISDIEVFTFNGKRMSMEFFSSLGGDLWRQIGQLTLYYWYLPLLGLILAAGAWLLDSKVESKIRERSVSWSLGAPLLLVLLGLSFVGIRGGLQHKSIHVQSAFIQGSNELGHLTLNTPYHFLRTFSTPRPPKIAWFSERELQTKLTELHHPPTYPGQKNHNIVLIVLESFSLEYFEEGFTPFLKELSSQGTFYGQHFANGRRSIEMLSSLLDSIPSVQEVPFSKSNAQGMPLEGVATKLKDAGYQTVFFHGASRGSMGFESYALSHGMQKYVSREDYPGPREDDDGKWGIFDGPFLQFSLQEMSRLKEPFFSSIFTLTSHQPYTIPKKFVGKFPKGTLEIHESVGYVDAMLREFFDEAKKQKWYGRTLFLITADHTQKLQSKKFNNSLGIYRVPLILFHPTVKLPMTAKTTQHVDVAASILDFVDVSEAGLNVVGESVFTPGEGRALQFLQPGWQYVRGNRVVRWVEGEQPRELQWDSVSGKTESVSESGLKQESQLFIQYLMNGFRANKWPFVLRE